MSSVWKERLFSSICAAALVTAGGAAAQSSGVGPTIYAPPSTEVQPGARHTNVKILVPPGPGTVEERAAKFHPLSLPAPSLTETPGSLACVYHLIPQSSGCNPNIVWSPGGAGGSKAIAVVDAFDNPSAVGDLALFSSTFNLPQANFQVIWGTGVPAAGCANGPIQPPLSLGSGWDIEASLDIEYAHAMAPNAKLYLVEALSSSNEDLLNAVAVATDCVQAQGGGQVSMSWGGPEFLGQNSYDFYFERANVTYFASAGDAPGVSWPASSPQVIGVGGTTWSRNQITGFYQSEGVWNDWAKGIGTGGGPSEIYSTPTYQQGIVQIVGEFRGTPDIAALADPYNGVWVFNSLNGGWQAVGGTSLASPVVAGIFNRQGWFFPTSFAALTNLYTLAAEKKLAPYVTDVNNGFCGPGHLAYPASNGNGYDPAYIEATTGLSWDWCTGWGTPRGPH